MQNPIVPQYAQFYKMNYSTFLFGVECLFKGIVTAWPTLLDIHCLYCTCAVYQAPEIHYIILPGVHCSPSVDFQLVSVQEQ